MNTDEAVEAIWMSSFEAPKADTHSEWAGRIRAILAAYTPERPKVLVEVTGGVADVTADPALVDVTVRDYDEEAATPPEPPCDCPDCTP